jgi:predicted alpha/beta-hydrolase family hydrolase
MPIEIRELTIRVTVPPGEVSALFMLPEKATHLLILAHGAGANMRHATMQAIAERLADTGIATLRYNFPYMEAGRPRVDSPQVSAATVCAAAAKARELAPDLPLLSGGHSFGGRMTTTAASEAPIEGVKGIILFSFPLHMPDKPAAKRAEHLSSVTVPMLFLSGTRDKLADLDLLKPVVEKLGALATLHLLDTADHSYKVLKRTRESKEDVFAEMARVIKDWLARKQV